MKAVDQFDVKAQDALRMVLLEELTGSHNDSALLKEHYDWLQELTSISKKTLKRFFREKIKVGPQTRNLLAAIALGKKEDLNSFSEGQSDYYLVFLESLQPEISRSDEIAKPNPPNPEFREILSACYEEDGFISLPEGIHSCLPLKAVRKRLVSDNDRFSLTQLVKNDQQELPVSGALLFNHTQPLLLGEAGMGKTTFARSLSYQWAVAKNENSVVPIYVDLKSPYYSRNENGVFDFLLTRYFGQHLDWMVAEFLERETTDYYLLLDGFDDLSVKEKDSLMHEIGNFSENVRYLILSRPYGFGDFGYPSRSVYEMLGFDYEGKETFLRSYIHEYGIHIELSFLVRYLQNHPVLSRLSRSPLSLLRIAGLTGNEMLYSLLDDVKSGLDLQHLLNNHFGERI